MQHSWLREMPRKRPIEFQCRPNDEEYCRESVPKIPSPWMEAATLASAEVSVGARDRWPRTRGMGHRVPARGSA